MGPNPGTPGGASREPRRFPAATAGAVLVLATLLAVGSCGPDRRNEVLGPAGDKIDEPLAANAWTFTVAPDGAACSQNLKVKVNPSNVTATATGYTVNGSLFADTGAYGPLRFANGTFSLTTAPGDPATIIGLDGDGAAVFSMVGVFSDFVPNLVGIRANFGLRTGTAVQDLDIPIPNDNTCYVFIGVKFSGSDFELKGKEYDIGLLETTILIDPADPLYFFHAKLLGLPGLGKANSIKRAAIGISTQGRLQSTATAIPDRILSGHLFFGATVKLPKPPLFISGDICVRYPDFNSSHPEYTFSVDGSVLLLQEQVAGAIQAIIPTFTKEMLHLGDGTTIVSLAVTRQNGDTVPLPDVRVDWMVQSADLLGNLTELVGLQDVISATKTASIGGFIDTEPPSFGLSAIRDVSVAIPGVDIGLGLTQHLLVSSDGGAQFGLSGGIDAAVVTVHVSGDIGTSGFLLTGSAGFNAAPGTEPTRFGIYGDISLSIGYPSGFSFAGALYGCTGTCFTATGFDITIGSSPRVCVTVGVEVCIPP